MAKRVRYGSRITAPLSSRSAAIISMTGTRAGGPTGSATGASRFAPFTLRARPTGDDIAPAGAPKGISASDGARLKEKVGYKDCCRVGRPATLVVRAKEVNNRQDDLHDDQRDDDQFEPMARPGLEQRHEHQVQV